jgi:hypothetical protein
MASTYSTNLKIELIATGEQAGTWGTTTNGNLGTALEQAIVGYGNPNFTTDADLTITLTDSNASQIARAFALNVTSGVSLTTTRNLIVPTIQKPYLIYNATTGSQSIIVKTSAGTGVTVPNGARTLVYVDGTNVVSSVSNLPTLTLNTALAATSGGTGQSSYAIGDLLYASTSTALSKLADVATGNALISGGIGVAPAWGKIGLTTHVSGTLPVANGGTGDTTYTNGQLLIGNTTGNTLTKATLTAGTGITITNGTGSITIAGNTGTVASVSGTGTVNGITLSGTVTSSGSLTLGGALSGVSLTTQVTGSQRWDRGYVLYRYGLCCFVYQPNADDAKSWDSFCGHLDQRHRSAAYYWSYWYFTGCQWRHGLYCDGLLQPDYECHRDAACGQRWDRGYVLYGLWLCSFVHLPCVDHPQPWDSVCCDPDQCDGLAAYYGGYRHPPSS